MLTGAQSGQESMGACTPQGAGGAHTNPGPDCAQGGAGRSGPVIRGLWLTQGGDKPTSLAGS